MAIGAKHLYHLEISGRPACKNLAANFISPLPAFRSEVLRCKRCENRLAQMDAVKTRRLISEWTRVLETLEPV